MEVTPVEEDTRMETRKVIIPTISCAHCGRTIERELGELAGVEQVTVDVAGKTATIVWEAPGDWPAIEALLNEIGYAPQT
jgi:copper chaperone